MRPQNIFFIVVILALLGFCLWAFFKPDSVKTPSENVPSIPSVAKCEIRSCYKDESIVGECPCNCEGKTETVENAEGMIVNLICREPKG